MTDVTRLLTRDERTFLDGMRAFEHRAPQQLAKFVAIWKADGVDAALEWMGMSAMLGNANDNMRPLTH